MMAMEDSNILWTIKLIYRYSEKQPHSQRIRKKVAEKEGNLESDITRASFNKDRPIS
jgi:hypothetical protein